MGWVLLPLLSSSLFMACKAVGGIAGACPVYGQCPELGGQAFLQADRILRRPNGRNLVQTTPLDPSFDAFLDPTKTTHHLASQSSTDGGGATHHQTPQSQQATQTPVSQSPQANDNPFAANVGTVVQIPFCASPNRPVWTRLCAHWSKSLEIQAIQKGSAICCSSLPSPCRGSETCSNADSCLVPSCDQAEWYLNTVEQDSDQAFRIFGLDTAAFRQCGFTMVDISCSNASHPDFGVTEASLAALVALTQLDSSDFEATAWEVVGDLVVASETSDHSVALVDGFYRRAVKNGKLHQQSFDRSTGDKHTM